MDSVIVRDGCSVRVDEARSAVSVSDFGSYAHADDVSSYVEAHDADNFLTLQFAYIRNGEVIAQEKFVTPTEEQQVVLPDADYDYLSRVTVAAIEIATEQQVTAAVDAGWGE